MHDIKHTLFNMCIKNYMQNENLGKKNTFVVKGVRKLVHITGSFDSFLKKKFIFNYFRTNFDDKMVTLVFIIDEWKYMVCSQLVYRRRWPAYQWPGFFVA